MDPKIYTTTDLAKILEASDSTIRREIKRNKLKCFYVGNEARFTQVHIEDYMNIRDFGMTEREMKLEERIKELEVVIKDKDKLLGNIKNLLLREA